MAAKPSKPGSCIVGNVGRPLARFRRVCAIATIWSLCTCGVAAVMVSKPCCTWPPIRPVSAGPLPLQGTWMGEARASPSALPGARLPLAEAGIAVVGLEPGFGNEAKHRQVSMQMAEATLPPAIRHPPSAIRQQADAVVVAGGRGCRRQIADGAQRQAVHAARLRASLP